MNLSYSTSDATELAEQIRLKRFSPLQMTTTAIDRIQQVNPRINAVIHPRFDNAREEARSLKSSDSPFRGVPMLVKDLLCATAGDPYHAGMAFLRDRKWISKSDSHLATRFRQAGFIILGRTNTPELGTSATTEPAAYGPTLNPWNFSHSTGGSSGGSAAAVASGMVPVAHGNDMGGSVRIPASACGLIGLKPSRGRISLGPDYSEYWGPLAQDGLLTRSVRDLAGVLDAISGSMPGDPVIAPAPRRPYVEELDAGPAQLRIGLLPEEWDLDYDVHRECRDAVSVTGRLLEKSGHLVEHAAPPALAAGRGPTGPLVGAYVMQELANWSNRFEHAIGPDDVEPWTWQLAETGRRMSAVAYLMSLEQRYHHARELCQWWHEGFDILVTPTLPQPPAELGRNPEEINAVYGKFTIPWNFTGQPAISLPIGVTKEGLPVGVQLVANYGREDLLIGLAAQIERLQPWPLISRLCDAE